MDKIKQFADVRVNKIYDKAEEYTRSGRLESAIKVLKHANIKDFDNYAGLSYGLGWYLNRTPDPHYKDNYHEAEMYLLRAIKIDPNHGDYHYELGECLKAQGDYEGALECYKKALEINPDSGNYYAALKDHMENCWEHGIRPPDYEPDLDNLKWDDDFEDGPSLR